MVARIIFSPLIPFPLRCRLRWRIDQGIWLARRPELFSRKVEWRRLKDHRRLLAVCSDRVAVREYVAAVVGPELLPECLALVDDPRALVRGQLPREFVAKATHGSGGIWVVADGAPAEITLDDASGIPRSGRPGPWDKLVVSPEGLDWELMTSTLARTLSQSFGDRYLTWGYRDVPRRVIVEERLAAGPGELVPSDHRIFVFAGKARLIQVNSARFLDRRLNLYSPEWTPREFEFDDPTGPPRPQPPTLTRMLEVAEALGKELEFVRVDLYESAERVVFGELTAYPGAPVGAGAISPELDRELGALWTLPKLGR